MPLTPQQIDELALLAPHLPVTELALHLGVSEATIRRHLKRLGLSPVPARSRAQIRFRHLLREVLPLHRILEEYPLGERLRLDFYLPELHLGIELDGNQHYECHPFFHGDPEAWREARYRDQRKEELCVQQGITLWRFPSQQLPSALELRERLLALAELPPPATPSPSGWKEKQRAWRRQQYQRQRAWRRRRLQQTDSTGEPP